MTTPTINVGRLFTTPKGLFGIRLDCGTEVLGPQGSGMTKEVAERVLDAIERRQGKPHDNTFSTNRSSRFAGSRLRG